MGSHHQCSHGESLRQLHAKKGNGQDTGEDNGDASGKALHLKGRMKHVEPRGVSRMVSCGWDKTIASGEGVSLPSNEHAVGEFLLYG